MERTKKFNISKGKFSSCHFKNSVFVIWENMLSRDEYDVSPIFEYYDEHWHIQTYQDSPTMDICLFNLTCLKKEAFLIQLCILSNNEVVASEEKKHNFIQDLEYCSFPVDFNAGGSLMMCFQISCTENKTNENALQKECNDAEHDEVSEDLKAAVENGKHSDVLLKLAEVTIPAHKVILSCRSKVFQAMFDNDCKENSENAVDLVDMDVATAKSMLQYIYTGNAGEFTSDNVIKLYSVADRYCLMGLIKQCRQFMVRRMDADNVCEIASAADLHSDEALMEAVQAFFSQNLKQIMKSDKCKMLSKRNPTLFFKLVEEAVSSNNLTPISKA